MHFVFVLFSVVVVIISADDQLSSFNDSDEMDSIFADLLNGDFDNHFNYEQYDSKNIQENEEDEPQLSDGVWKCGNCTNINESKLLFSEHFALDTNYNENVGLELQIGFSVQDMRCITIETEAITVRRVSGACAGEEVTFSVIQKSNFEVNIYE